MKTKSSSMRASELLKSKFGVSQLYKYEVKQDEEVVLEIFWHPLTISERESIQKKTGGDDANEFALSLMLEKALDADGKRLFQDGEKAVLKNAVDASILQEIQLAMLTSGTENKVEDAKADLKSAS
jgi:hypothetical protein|tara:strand:- start:2659 stop:3036 length:378 start_codon:yes stop_codon:yes gene_type:complete